MSAGSMFNTLNKNSQSSCVFSSALSFQLHWRLAPEAKRMTGLSAHWLLTAN